MSDTPGDDATLPTDKELVMRVIPMPADTNASGDIFGGWVMAQVDLAGAVLPIQRTAGPVATVAVNQFVFKQPVRVGDLLSFYAEIVRVGNTSITVDVGVYAQRLADNAVHVKKVTEAQLTYVSLGPDRKPRTVPKLS